MKRTTLALTLGLVASAAGAQTGENPTLCTIEATPAPTVLLPYFEVDIDDPNGIDTFLSVNNALPFSVLGHVVVWTDMSVEALDFNIYLTGYDVQTIGLGLIIRNGILPATSFDDSPIGPFSIDKLAGTGAACGVLPYEVPALDEEFLDHLQSILTGGPSSAAPARPTRLSDACVPRSAILPSSRTRIRSASRMVLSRWAITMRVQLSSLNCSSTWDSVTTSRWLVASSRKRIAGRCASARAIDSRWR